MWSGEVAADVLAGRVCMSAGRMCALDMGGMDVACGLGGARSLREARVACISLCVCESESFLNLFLELASASFAQECDGCDAHGVSTDREVRCQPIAFVCWP